MAAAIQYDRIVKYNVTAVCAEPLHIGNADGVHEEVLVHPVYGIPFIQASSIAGVFRDRSRRIFGEERTAGMFGSENREDEEDAASRTRFTDGIFGDDRNGIKMELRPRVSIDRVTGTCKTSNVSGTSRKSGHKFNMEYIGAGAEFHFSVYAYVDSAKSDTERDIELLFVAAKGSNVQFGGQKSNGCGFVGITSLKKAVFDMKDAAGREKWLREEELPDKEYTEIADILPAYADPSEAYEITVNGMTENELLVRGISVMDYEKESPDAENIKNAKGDYIVPGSALKGSVRSQMEKIAGYLNMEEVIENSFGTASDAGNRGGRGNITFFDTVVGERVNNDRAKISYRIHLDKFTGGVIDGGLFSEKNVSGAMQIKIRIGDTNEPEKTCAVLLLALRDMAIGAMSMGSGYSIGKGIVSVEEICIADRKNGFEARLDYQRNEVIDENGLIEKLLASISKRGD